MRCNVSANRLGARTSVWGHRFRLAHHLQNHMRVEIKSLCEACTHAVAVKLPQVTASLNMRRITTQVRERNDE